MGSQVAVVVPIWQEELSEFEKISFQQCCSILSNYTFHLVTYKSLRLDNYIKLLEEKSVDYKFTYFGRKSFGSVDSYSKLMLSVSFYRRFLSYKYVLIYQLDCFVFRDELEQWIAKGYSYIGAPWLKGYNYALSGATIEGVGNGGFSLRNVGDHMRVLLSFSYIKEPKLFLKETDSISYTRVPLTLSTYLQDSTVRNNTFFLFNNWSQYEDVFWGKIAARNFSWFTVPEYQIAAQFSVEVQPKMFFEMNSSVIPFGCHAWWTYDLDFWKPYIEEFGYSLT